MKKKELLLDSDSFDSSPDKEQLIAYFIGCALESDLASSAIRLGLCTKEEWAGYIAKQAASIAEGCFNEYCRMVGGDIAFESLVNSVRWTITCLKEMPNRGLAEDELLAGLMTAIESYEKDKEEKEPIQIYPEKN